jgi:hypothetical protein
MARVLRHVLVVLVLLGGFSLGSTAGAAEASNFGLPVVAADSHSESESAPETQPRPNDELWLTKPFSAGLSTILGLSDRVNPFFMPGAEFAYALPHVSFGGTLGYLNGLNASLAVRGRLHLGHAVAVTLGARVTLVPLDDGCFLDLGLSETHCTQKLHWSQAFFSGGEGGIEGRTRSGFLWRVQLGYWGLVAHGRGTCTVVRSAIGCPVTEPRPGPVFTQEVTFGWSF